MNFIVVITRSERKPNGETKILKRVQFEAPSITAGKVKATKIANAVTFLKGKIYGDRTKDLTGKDLRWKAWDVREHYEQENGIRVGWSGKRAESFTGNYDPETRTSPNYFAWVTLNWEIAA